MQHCMHCWDGSYAGHRAVLSAGLWDVISTGTCSSELFVPTATGGRRWPRVPGSPERLGHGLLFLLQQPPGFLAER